MAESILIKDEEDSAMGIWQGSKFQELHFKARKKTVFSSFYYRKINSFVCPSLSFPENSVQ